MTSRVAAVELGTLLGWMSGRVLGQYDLLLVDEADGGTSSTTSGPTCSAWSSASASRPDEFRLWVLLHEVTHRAQFTGVPWLAPHFLGLVDQALTVADPTPASWPAPPVR